ncbi:hypothetical protein C8J31_1205 [Rhizobium sp. PP-CC-2G-626]|nr:hypothetical protein C8J31_1205 [Rhizobium sp. PP-CC-2G-626]
MVAGRIPIIVGITGHRDLRSGDLDLLDTRIEQCLQEVRASYPCSPVTLLTSLAEGADQLAARCALRIAGVSMVAVLPLELDDYKKDFLTETAKQEFDGLLNRATNVISASTLPGKATTREEYYLRAGCFVAQTAQIMIAVWDGISHPDHQGGLHNPLKGGTADIVRACRHGIRSSSLVAVSEPTLVKHIFTVREQSSAEFVAGNSHRIGQLQQVAEQDTVSTRTSAILSSIERFNAAASTVPEEQAAAAVMHLLKDDDGTLSTSGVTPELAVYARADSLASLMQKQRLLGIRLIAAMTVIAIVLQQVYSGPDMRLGWLLGYVVMACIAFLTYCWFFRGKHRRDERYLDWRSIAEAVRVHIFWRLAGIERSVADDYFLEDTDDLEWLRHAVRNASLASSVSRGRDQLVAVKRIWLDGQNEYFRLTIPRNANREAFLKWAIRGLLTVAGITTAATLVSHLLDAPPELLNGLVLSSGICFLLAGTAKIFSEQMAFGELANRYAGMSLIFGAASARFDESYQRGDFATCSEILIAVGRQALAENVGWLRIHRQRAFEFSFG